VIQFHKVDGTGIDVHFSFDDSDGLRQNFDQIGSGVLLEVYKKIVL